MIGILVRTANHANETTTNHRRDSPGRESQCCFFALRFPAPSPEAGYVVAEGSSRVVVDELLPRQARTLGAELTAVDACLAVTTSLAPQSGHLLLARDLVTQIQPRWGILLLASCGV
jgi:hypothetical protein